MRTLQHKLRQLRSWQGKTLRQIAFPQRDSLYVSLENGDSGAQLHPIENTLTKEAISTAYGIRQSLFHQWLEDEYEWRLCAATGNPETLPRLARYLYRPLPEAVRNLFIDGFMLLDLETTGKDAHAPETEIVEITILDTDGMPVLNSLVKPVKPIPVEVTALHGISDEDVKEAPTFQEVYPEIARVIEGQTLVIYNADYDSYLLDNLIIRNGLDMPAFEQWCLMKAYSDYQQTPKAPGKTYGGKYAWHKLSVACEQQGIVLEDAHRALGDTLATWKLLQKLASLVEQEVR